MDAIGVGISWIWLAVAVLMAIWAVYVAAAVVIGTLAGAVMKVMGKGMYNKRGRWDEQA